MTLGWVFFRSRCYHKKRQNNPKAKISKVMVYTKSFRTLNDKPFSWVGLVVLRFLCCFNNLIATWKQEIPNLLKWRDQGSNPGPIAPQDKSLIIQQSPLPFHRLVFIISLIETKLFHCNYNNVFSSESDLLPSVQFGQGCKQSYHQQLLITGYSNILPSQIT